MKLEKVNIYRITHIENIPQILNYGITNKKSKHKNPNYKAIGDTCIINTRNNKEINITNGGIETIKTIELGDYIPFYFGIKMPMLYVIQRGGNFVPRRTIPENIVYVVCSVIKIHNFGYEYYFSDGHALNKLSTFYNRDKLIDLIGILDWNAIKKPYWQGEGNLDVKRKKQAEFIVKEDLSPECIIGFGCYNERAKNNLKGLGVNEKIIRVIPNAYF